MKCAVRDRQAAHARPAQSLLLYKLLVVIYGYSVIAHRYWFGHRRYRFSTPGQPVRSIMAVQYYILTAICPRPMDTPFGSEISGY